MPKWLQTLIASRPLGDLVLIAVMSVACVGAAFAGMAATGEGFATVEQVTGNKTAIEANTSAINELSGKVDAQNLKIDALYLKSLSESIYTRTKIKCGLVPGSAARDDYELQVEELRKEYRQLTQRDYTQLRCEDIAQ